jgi:hypothetical protein
MRIGANGLKRIGVTSAALVFVAQSALASSIAVGIDMSTPVHLARNAASVVVGNPAIADVYVQDGRLVFVQGRSFGTTNLIALDSKGKEILNARVTVTVARGQTVTLQRGIGGRISYACAGRCEPTVIPGDSAQESKELLDAFNSKAGAAEQAAQAGQKGAQ